MQEKSGKKLIVNVDDVGLSEAVNEAAEACFLSDVITGVSITACGRHFQEAAYILRSLERKEAGVHLMLTGSLAPCTVESFRVRSLLRKNGRFVRDYRSFAARCWLGKIQTEQLYLEFSNQIKKVKEQGLEVTHLDSHEHVHMFPDVLAVVLRLASEFNVPYVRFSLEKSSVMRRGFSAGDLLRRAALGLFTPEAGRLIYRSNIKHNDFFLGHFHSGRINDSILCFMLEDLSDGVTELAVHPGSAAAGSKKMSARAHNAAVELDTLLNGRWKEVAEANNIRLVSHREAVR